MKWMRHAPMAGLLLMITSLGGPGGSGERTAPPVEGRVGEPDSRLGFPAGLALAPDGHVAIADRRLNRVFLLDPDTGALRLLAGTGEGGFSGDGGPATEARLLHPEWVAYETDGDLLVADRGNGRIRRVDPTSGRIETIAGTGSGRASGDGGPATQASLTSPFGVSVGPGGGIFVFDTEAHSIRRIDPESGVIRTVVGRGEQGFGGDGGPGRAALLSRPHNGIFDSRGRLVFGDSFNHRIRRWDPATDAIATLAGTGDEGVSPAGTPASAASFTYFGGLLEEPDGSLVYSGLEGRIMRIRASDGRLEHVAGSGQPGFGGDGGTALEAQFRVPYGLVRLPDGDILVADAGNGRIRRIDAATGHIDSVAGEPPGDAP